MLDIWLVNSPDCLLNFFKYLSPGFLYQDIFSVHYCKANTGVEQQRYIFSVLLFSMNLTPFFLLKSCIIGENLKLLMLEGYDTLHEAY